MRDRFRPVLLGVLLLAGAASAGAALEAEVAYVLGEVGVRHGGARLEAQPGMQLEHGDVVSTGADGLAILALGGGTELKLRESTVLALDSLEEETTVRLTAGGVFSRVAARLRGRYSVRVENAIAGVRGTEFFVAYGRRIEERPDVWLCVNSGQVEVTVSGDRVVVEEGKGINIIAGRRLTRPRPYAWTRALNWNMDPGQGKVVDRTDLGRAYSDLLDQDYD